MVFVTSISLAFKIIGQYIGTQQNIPTYNYMIYYMCRMKKLHKLKGIVRCLKNSRHSGSKTERKIEKIHMFRVLFS